MFYYIFVFTVTTLLGFWADKKKMPHQRTSSIKVQQSWVSFTILFVYVLFVGCRGYNVGADTPMYVDRLREASTTPYLEFIASRGFIEPLFYSLVWVFGNLANAWVFFVFSSFVYFLVFLKFSFKYSNSLGWSIWILNSMGLATLAISNVRQSLAISLCLIAYMCLDKSKWKPLLFVVLAICTHLSAIVFAPMLFVNQLRKRNILLIIVVLLAIVIIAGSELMGNLALSYALSTGKEVYETADEEGVGGLGMIVFLGLIVIMGAVSYFPKKDKYPSQYYSEFIAVSLALIVFIISRFNQGTMRLFWYYLAFCVIYIPNVFGVKKQSVRQLLQIVVFVITVYYLSTRIMANPYEETRMLLPYSFVWD